MRRCQAAAWNRLPPAWQEVAERAVKKYFSWDCNGSPALFTKKSALCIIDNLSPCAIMWASEKNRIVAPRCLPRKRRVKRESGVNPERYSHCVRESSASHWETGKGRPAMIEVRRPASAWNLKSAVYGLTFLQV